MIREINKNIYENKKIDKIFYISSQKKENFIRFKPYVSIAQNEKEPVIPIKYFSTVKKFQNNELKDNKISISQAKIKKQSNLNLHYSQLNKLSFIDANFSNCTKEQEDQGLRIFCKNPRMACVYRPLNTAFSLGEDSIQLGIFSYINGKANSQRGIAFLINNKLDKRRKIFEPEDFKKNYYLLNYLVDYPDNLDPFKRNLLIFAQQIQRIQTNKNLMLCMLDYLVQGQNLIKGISFINLNLFPN
jgi:hypothetical protein